MVLCNPILNYSPFFLYSVLELLTPNYLERILSYADFV